MLTQRCQARYSQVFRDCKAPPEAEAFSILASGTYKSFIFSFGLPCLVLVVSSPLHTKALQLLLVVERSWLRRLALQSQEHSAVQQRHPLCGPPLYLLQD